MFTRPFGLALFAACLASPLSSQRLTQRAGLSVPVSSAAERSMWVNARRDVAPNNWVKGAVIGGSIGLAIGLFLGRPWDSDNGSGARHLFLGTTALGAVIGGLIGSGSKKQ